MSRSRMCIGLALGPALAAVALLAVVGGAAAQDEPRGPTPRVAVFPFFVDDADGAERMTGRRASDAILLALREASPWEPVDSGWLLRLLEAEGARAPLAAGYLQMVGHRANAPLGVTGTVETLRLNVDRGIAQVTVAVELVETLSGTRLAASRGVAAATREDGEALGQAIDRALMEAGADAARDLTSFDPLSAVVVATLPDGRVMLDGPQDPRIRSGSKLMIYRAGRTGPEVVGAVEVQTSRVTVLHARPLAGEDFRQGDRAVVVAR